MTSTPNVLFNCSRGMLSSELAAAEVTWNCVLLIVASTITLAPNTFRVTSEAETLAAIARLLLYASASKVSTVPDTLVEYDTEYKYFSPGASDGGGVIGGCEGGGAGGGEGGNGGGGLNGGE